MSFDTIIICRNEFDQKYQQSDRRGWFAQFCVRYAHSEVLKTLSIPNCVMNAGYSCR